MSGLVDCFFVGSGFGERLVREVGRFMRNLSGSIENLNVKQMKKRNELKS